MPAFKCWNPENGDEDDWTSTIDAFDAETAAEKFAEHDDVESADYIFATSGGRVCVRDAGGELHTFEVSAETVPVYHASRPSPGQEGGGA